MGSPCGGFARNILRDLKKKYFARNISRDLKKKYFARNILRDLKKKYFTRNILQDLKKKVVKQNSRVGDTDTKGRLKQPQPHAFSPERRSSLKMGEIAHKL